MTHNEKNYYDLNVRELCKEWLRTKNVGDLAPFIEAVEPGGRVLDLGCGNGIDLAWLYKAGFRNLVGLDSSSSMVMAAKAIHQHTGVEILEKNFLFSSFKEGEWDGVWSNLSFIHLAPEELQRLLAICFKGVKVGGVIGAVLYEGSAEFDGTIHRYTEKALCSMFEQTGFQVIKVGRKVEEHDPLPKILILAKRV